MAMTSRVARSAAVLSRAARTERLLTSDELDRADAFVRETDRADFVAAHVLVRTVAAEALSAEPSDLTIVQRCATCHGPHGRPTIAEAPEIAVSLAHTSGWVAAAAADRPCGIDVERVDPKRSPHLPGRVINAAERRWIADAEDSATAFARVWVRKEALVKAGVCTLDTAVDVELLAGTALLEVVRGHRLQDLTVEGHDAPAAATAVRLAPSHPGRVAASDYIRLR